jgi:hypothetical protein
MDGSAELNVIVPLTLKLTVSAPEPAAHPSTAASVLAAVIASRSEHEPAVEVSLVVFTVIVAARALAASAKIAVSLMSARGCICVLI